MSVFSDLKHLTKNSKYHKIKTINKNSLDELNMINKKHCDLIYCNSLKQSKAKQSKAKQSKR